MKIEELEKELKQGILRNLYLLYGEEKFLLESSLKTIKKLFGEKIPGINYIILDDTNVSELITDIETPAFGYEKKLIIAKNAQLFKKDSKKKKIDDNIKEKLNKYILENFDVIKQSVVLVFIEDAVEKCELLTTFEKMGIVCNFEHQKPIQIQNRLKAMLTAYKINVDNYTLSYFIECCGTDMQELINELKKLVEYVDSGNTMTKQDVDNLVIKKMESVIFDLTDCLGKKNVAQAIGILRNLILSKEPLPKILITLYNHFKKLYLTKYALNLNKDIAESLDLRPNQKFLVNKYKAQASYFSSEELRIILKELCDLDYKYKSGLIDMQVGLESILCTYI